MWLRQISVLLSASVQCSQESHAVQPNGNLGIPPDPYLPSTVDLQFSFLISRIIRLSVFFASKDIPAKVNACVAKTNKTAPSTAKAECQTALVTYSKKTQDKTAAAGIAMKPARPEQRSNGLYFHANLKAADMIARPSLQVFNFPLPIRGL